MQKELDVIMGLMKDLQEKMQYGEDDLSERLGRKKPELEIAKISVGKPGEDKGEGMIPEMMGAMKPDADESPEDMDDEEMEEEAPEDKLKNRLMRLRG